VSTNGGKIWVEAEFLDFAPDDEVLLTTRIG
jgi:hypothetical protein